MDPAWTEIIRKLKQKYKVEIIWELKFEVEIQLQMQK